MRRTYARSLDDTFDIAYQVMTSERFIEMEGLGNEVPYFVLRYPSGSRAWTRRSAASHPGCASTTR